MSPLRTWALFFLLVVLQIIDAARVQTIAKLRLPQISSPKTNDDMGALLTRASAEEEAKYKEQMLSAMDDKQRMLAPWVARALGGDPFKLAVIDIGPAGGAIPLAVAKMIHAQGKDATNSLITYTGVELSPDMVVNVTKFLESQHYPNQANQIIDGFGPWYYPPMVLPTHVFESARVVEKNALDLVNVFKSEKFPFTLIVESSVVHEIYSYAQYPDDPQITMPAGAEFAVQKIEHASTGGRPAMFSYNPKTVYKNYEQALLQLSKTGGMLSVRDGVLYENPGEDVVFKLLSDDFVTMLTMFGQDRKYPQVQAVDIQKKMDIRLPAKLVQEFMLKANWGLEGWKNEINEVYCYATLDTHKAIVQKIITEHGLKAKITKSQQYAQYRYIENLATNLEIVSGFQQPQRRWREGTGFEAGKQPHFPPTNMLLQVEVEKPGSPPRGANEAA
jgi:hypothetical protein